MSWLENNNVIIVGGGCGTAPVRGVIEYIDQNRKDFKDTHVFFGFRGINDMLFEEDYKRWKDNNIKVDFILSESKNHPRAKQGLITEILDTDITKDNKDKIVVICGPTPMIKAVCKYFTDKGFNKDQIYFSEERHMKCGVGRCGHCMIQDKYCCTDGPVFRYDEIDGYVD